MKNKANLQSSLFNPQSMVNKGLPYIMHIDLNSCFAIIEQQANRLLRGRPVGVAAYDTPRGFVVAASYEAKAKGIKLGVNVEQSRVMAPGIVIMTPDPAKYREAHRLFKNLMLEYTPDVTPKSIDEFVLDFANSPVYKKMLADLQNSSKYHVSSIMPSSDESTLNTNYLLLDTARQDFEREVHNKAMLEIGEEIKTKIRERLGEWVTVNIGIATNRFLAKYAAGFDKPDGMTLIDHTNLHSKYENMKLVDLPGINTGFRARLRAQQIYTPLDFLDADVGTLKKQVFKSVVGHYWYLRLRGHEIDDYETKRGQIGHQHAMKEKITDIAMLERLLMKLCEKTGRRLRSNNYYAQGAYLYIGFSNQSTSSQAQDVGASEQMITGDPYAQHYLSDYDERTYEERKRHRAKDAEHVHAGFNLSEFSSWHHGEKVHYRLYSTSDIYRAAKNLLRQATSDDNYAQNGEFRKKVKILAFNVYDLQPWDPVQLNIFEIKQQKVKGKKQKAEMVEPDMGSRGVREQAQDWGLKIGESPHRSLDARKRISDAVDAINDRYGEFVVTPALMMEMQGTILDRIAFGNAREL